MNRHQMNKHFMEAGWGLLSSVIGLGIIWWHVDFLTMIAIGMIAFGYNWSDAKRDVQKLTEKWKEK